MEVTAPTELRQKAALESVRSALGGLVVVGALGIIGAFTSYQADINEAKRFAAARVSKEVRLYADALALHFDVLRAELQRFAERPRAELMQPGPALDATLQDDASLFMGGVALLDTNGAVRWSRPSAAITAIDPSLPWFQSVLRTQESTIDAFSSTDTTHLVVALPLREGPLLTGVLIGVVHAHERLLYGVEGHGEHLLLLAGDERVVLPIAEPSWSQGAGFRQLMAELLKAGGEGSVRLGGSEMMADALTVRGTRLEVLAVESDEVAFAPIRRRFKLQLGFLLLLQVAALMAFWLFLRRTYRTFVEVEAGIAKQETMVALGAASALIAHEVKNSLNGIKGAAALLEHGGEVALANATIRGQVDRLGHLAKSLLDFARGDVPTLKPVLVAQVIRDAVEGLSSLPERSACELLVDVEGPFELETDPLLLVSAIDNLIRNAIEAAVAAKDVGRQSAPRVTVQLKGGPGRLEVIVEDNAGGTPPGFEQRLGEPFFTTKPKGVGLGLSMARGAMERLGGGLTFTRLAEGSRFLLWLPVNS